MRNIKFCLFLLIATGWTAGAHAKVTQVFIVAGQSNALGSARRSKLPPELLVQPDVRFWFDIVQRNSRGVFQDLKADLRFGPEINLGRVLADHLDEEVAIIKVAQGNTTLAKLQGKSDWNVGSGGELYDRLIRNVKLATADIVSRGDTPRLAGMFWMQGESDALSSGTNGSPISLPQPSTASAYETNLTRLISSVRSDLKTPEFPFFIGEIKIGDDPFFPLPESEYNTRLGQFDYTPTIQAAQRAVAAADPRAFFIGTQGFSQVSGDFVHFDSVGQLALGAAFANAYLATVPEPSSGSLILVTTISLLCFRRSPRRSTSNPGRFAERVTR